MNELPKMAIGHFYNAEYGTDYYGVMADVIFGKVLIGNGLSLACPDINGGAMHLEADGKGVRLHNSRFSLDHDRGGQIILDPTVGFALGQNGMFEFDDDGKVVFNESKANTYIDMNGKLRIKGIFSDGEIYGSIIKGGEMYIGGNETVENCVFGVDAAGKVHGIETANGKLRFDSEGRAYFDNDVNISGNLTLSGNINMVGKIIYSPKNIPNKKRYAASMSGPWHDTMQSGDIYCCDWNYATETWGEPYKKVGQDGRPGSNGSDANVDYANIKAALQKAASIPTAFMSVDEMGAPKIYGGEIYGAKIYAGDGADSFAQMDGDGFYVYVSDVDTPKVHIGVDSEGYSPEITLGAGDGTGKNIFRLTKNPYIGMIEHVASSGARAGFIFNDGTITPLGELNVPARFG